MITRRLVIRRWVIGFVALGVIELTSTTQGASLKLAAEGLRLALAK